MNTSGSTHKQAAMHKAATPGEEEGDDQRDNGNAHKLFPFTAAP